jgi:phosphate transport system permease protein
MGLRQETSSAPGRSLTLIRKPSLGRFLERALRLLCLCAALISIGTTVGILYILLVDASSLFQTVSIPDFFFGTRWEPQAMEPKYGVLPLMGGTLLITFGSALISVPLGLLSAIYLSEYAPTRARQILKPALELLAGVPTVVYGYFALFAVTPFLRFLGWNVASQNAAAGSIVVGIMTLPLVASLCEDALSAVPRSLREAAFGLGSTKMEVITKVVLPAALSGVVASFILAISRAIGETMAVNLAAGATPRLTLNPAEGVQTMTAYIVSVSKGDVDRGTMDYTTIFAVGATLFFITLALNLVAQRIVKKFRSVYT